MSEIAPVVDAERERIYRRNYPFFLADFILFSVALNMLGPSTVIPDFVRRLTDIEVLIGLSGQLFDVGWLLPQLLIARYLVGVARKKWWFAGPNIPVRTFVLIMSGLIVLLGPDRPSAILVVFLVSYGLAAFGDGLVGVPWMDLAGSSLDNRRRARMFGLGTAAVGVIMLGVAPLVRVILGADGLDFPNNYALVFGVAGIIFVLTIPLPVFIHELPGGQVQQQVLSLGQYLPHLGRVLRQDMPFRAMIAARVLSGLAAMASPFYIGFATESLDMSSDVAVGNLLLAQTIGSVSGALVFSWLSHQQPVQFIRLALLIGVIQPFMALLAGAVGPAPIYLAFLVAGFVQGTLVISFLNWVLIYTDHDQRPIYSGLFNSASAVALLTAPLIGGLLVEVLGYEAVFIAAAAILLSALYVALRYIDIPHPAQPAA